MTLLASRMPSRHGAQQMQYKRAFLQFVRNEMAETSHAGLPKALQDIPTAISIRLLAALRRTLISVPPVLLSKVAREFGIDPEPEFTDDLPTSVAMLVHDGTSFRIRVSRRHRVDISRLQLFGLSPDSGAPQDVGPESELSRRARFAYAHEFAHRFFYTRVGAKYLRIQELVLETARIEPDCLQAVRDHMQRLEEQYCNTTARRVLLPDTEVIAFVESFGPTRGPSFVQRLGRLVEDISRVFLVPRTTALLGIGDLIRSRVLSTDSNIFAMYIGAPVAVRNHTAELGRPRIEVSTGSLPGVRPSENPYLWKSDLVVLGSTLRDQVSRLIGSSALTDQQVRVPLAIPGRRDSERAVCLDGWWRLAQDRGRFDEYRGGLLWGVVHDAAEPHAY